MSGASWLLLPTRRPRATLAGLALAVLAALALLAARGLRAELGIEQLVAQGDAEFARYQELADAFGRDDNTVFVFAVRDRWFTPDGARLALATSEALADSDLVDEVVGPATATLIQDEGEHVYVGPILTASRIDALGAPGLARLERHLLSEPAYAGRVISKDGRTVAFAVKVDDRYYRAAYHPAVVAHVRAALARFDGRGVTFHVTGGPLTKDAYRRFLRQDTGRFVLATGAILVVALAVIFGDLLGVALPLSAVGLALLFTLALQSLAGIPINLLSSTIPVLILIVGISDAIHLTTRYREELALEKPPAEALDEAVVSTARACFLTSVTTSVGFFTLPATGIPMLADMGLVTGTGVLVSYVVTLVLLPAAFALARPPRRLPPAEGGPRLLRLARVAMARPGAVAVAFALGIGVLVAVGVPRLRVESRVIDDLPADHPLVRTRAAVEERMGGIFPLTLLVWPTPGEGDPLGDAELVRRVAAFQRRLPTLTDPPLASSSYSAADAIGLAWRALGGDGLPPNEAALAQVREVLGGERLARTVDPGGRFLRIETRVFDRGTAATYRFLEAARAAFAEELAGTARLEVQGFTYLAHRTHRDVVQNALTGFSLDFAIVALLVALLFRSVRLTVLALIPNVFPLLFTLAFMGLVGIDLRIGSAIVFSIVFGIAVDDTVHFLARFHEERERGLSRREAVARTVATTGRAMLFLAFVLGAGFAVLLGSAFAPNRVLGLLMAVTVGAGLLGDLILLPALLALERPAEAAST